MSAKKKDQGFEEVRIENLQSKLEKFQKPLSYIGIAILAIVGGYIGYKEFVLKPQQEEAVSRMYMAEKYFEQDSFKIALLGSATFVGFEEITDDYGMTEAGNLARFYAGVCNLHLGGADSNAANRTAYFEEAVRHLKKFKTSSFNLGPLGKGALGDAYSELGELEKAASAYKEAATMEKNEFSGPQYYLKLGLVYEELGQGQKAVDAYQSLKNEYPKSQTATTIDKYIARAQGIK